MIDDKDYYSGIGGSMCAAIMGMDKSMSPYDAWLRFTDPSTREDLSGNEPVLWGQLLELPVGMEAARRLGLAVEHTPLAPPIPHPTIPFMRARLDFRVLNEPALIECKARGLHQLKNYDLSAEDLDDSDRVLDTEAIQVHHYLTCTGFEVGYLAVLIGGQRLLTFKIRRDPDICSLIEQRCREFWGYVERNEPPPPINVSDCNRIWSRQRPGSVIEADEVIAAAVEQRRTLKEQIKAAEEQLEYVDFRIKSFMRDAEELRFGKKTLLTWKKNKDGRVFNEDQFAKDNPNGYAQYLMPREGDRVMRMKKP